MNKNTTAIFLGLLLLTVSCQFHPEQDEPGQLARLRLVDADSRHHEDVPAAYPAGKMSEPSMHCTITHDGGGRASDLELRVVMDEQEYRAVLVSSYTGETDGPVRFARLGGRQVVVQTGSKDNHRYFVVEMLPMGVVRELDAQGRLVKGVLARRGWVEGKVTAEGLPNGTAAEESTGD